MDWLMRLKLLQGLDLSRECECEGAVDQTCRVTWSCTPCAFEGFVRSGELRAMEGYWALLGIDTRESAEVQQVS